MTKKTFDHQFENKPAHAYYWTNPDGKQGGIVACSAILAPSVVVHPKSTVGEHAQIGNQVTLLEGCHVANYVRIGEGTKLGKNVTVKRQACLGAGLQIGDDVTIGPYTDIGARVKIGKNAYIEMRAMISAGLSVEPAELITAHSLRF